MKIEKNEYLENIFSKKSGREYDVAIMYSGGKDSAFLVYLLREIYHLRVKAVMVDNGFENDVLWEPMREFAKKAGVPLEIIRPDKTVFEELFRLLIKYREVFQKENINHLCFICNNLLWAGVAAYAAENEIPFVASGLSLVQLSSGRKAPLKPDRLANSIAEKSTGMIFANAYRSIMRIEDDSVRKEFYDYLEQVKGVDKSVTTVYPYIYHEIPVEQLKSTILEMGWTPPNRQTAQNYISSGCMIMRKVVSEMEKLGLVTINEREQVKIMMENGQLVNGNMEYAIHDASKDLVDLRDDIFKELGVKDILVLECIKQKRNFME